MKNYATKANDRGRPKAHTRRLSLECLVSIDLSNTEAGKLFHTN